MHRQGVISRDLATSFGSLNPNVGGAIPGSERVRRGLQRIHYERRGRERVPPTTLSAFVGISVDALREAIYVGPISLATRGKLTPFIEANEQGRLCRARRGRAWYLSIAEHKPSPPVRVRTFYAPPGITFGEPPDLCDR